MLLVNLMIKVHAFSMILAAETMKQLFTDMGIFARMMVIATL
jgi:hypothetical protein